MGGVIGVPVGSAFGLPGRAPADLAVLSGKVQVAVMSSMSMVPDELVERWQAAYRAYGQASRAAATAVPGNRDAARLMAAASRDVAATWGALGQVPDLPWWASAAVGAAVQAFEFQARDWEARAAIEGYSPAPSLRPTSQRPTSQRRQAGA